MLIGLVLNNEFHQIMINEKPIEFFENLRPQVARLPMKLNFSDEDNGTIVIVHDNINGEGTEPNIKERSEKLSQSLINQLVDHSSYPAAMPFIDGKLGGSVNYRGNEIGIENP